jgi:hypothetical protein
MRKEAVKTSPPQRKSNLGVLFIAIVFGAFYLVSDASRQFMNILLFVATVCLATWITCYSVVYWRVVNGPARLALISTSILAGAVVIALAMWRHSYRPGNLLVAGEILALGALYGFKSLCLSRPDRTNKKRD